MKTSQQREQPVLSAIKPLRPCIHGSFCGHGPSRTCDPWRARKAWCWSGAHLHRGGSEHSVSMQPAGHTNSMCSQQDTISMQSTHMTHRLLADASLTYGFSINDGRSHLPPPPYSLPTQPPLTGGGTEVLASLASRLLSAHQQAVLAGGALQCQLIKGQALAASLYRKMTACMSVHAQMAHGLLPQVSHAHAVAHKTHPICCPGCPCGVSGVKIHQN